MTSERKSTSELHPVVRRFVQDAGNTAQSFGVGRIVGQIYAYLYFSAGPRALADLQEALGISKGSASMGVRQLEQWDAVRKVWVKGDRKDYYEANDWLGRILKNALIETVGQRMTAYESLLGEAGEHLATSENDEAAAFVAERVAHLKRFHDRVRSVWNSPIVKTLTK